MNYKTRVAILFVFSMILVAGLLIYAALADSIGAAIMAFSAFFLLVVVGSIDGDSEDSDE